jgi:hypothetical protein
MRTGRSNSRPCHHPVDFVAECDGLEDYLFGRTIGIAIHLAPRLRGRAGDKSQVQASSVDVSHGSLSKRDLHFLKELLPLRLLEPNDEPSEAR